VHLIKLTETQEIMPYVWVHLPCPRGVGMLAALMVAIHSACL